MNWWKDGISLDESKVSAIIILTVIGVIFGLSIYYINGDISSNLITLLQTLILSVAGVNGIKSIADAVSNLKQKQNDITDYSNKI